MEKKQISGHGDSLQKGRGGGTLTRRLDSARIFRNVLPGPMSERRRWGEKTKKPAEPKNPSGMKSGKPDGRGTFR